MKKEVSDVNEADTKTSGTRKIRKLSYTLTFGKQKKDNKVVFVSGATGKVGSQVVRLVYSVFFLFFLGWNSFGERDLQCFRSVGLSN